MLRPVGLCLLACLGLALAADTPSRAVDVLWIDRPAAQPWLPAIAAAAERTSLAPALIAELIGQESGFNQSVKNPRSSARGLGQQIDGNDTLRRYHLNRASGADSIMGAALELREKWDHTGSLDRALLAYGTTSGLTATQRRRILGRMYAAAGSEAYQLPGEAVGRQPARGLEAAQPRQSLVIADDVGHGGTGRHQPR